jgi:hypothetical protein
MIFPLAVFGRASTISTARGYLYAAIVPFAKSMISSSVALDPGLQGDERLDVLITIGIPDTDDRRFADRRVLEQILLDFARPHFVSRRVDHVLCTVDDAATRRRARTA